MLSFSKMTTMHFNRSCVSLYVCVCVRLFSLVLLLPPCRHCGGSANQLLAFMVRSRTRTMAAAVSDVGLADHPRLVDIAGAWSEICPRRHSGLRTYVHRNKNRLVSCFVTTLITLSKNNKRVMVERAPYQVINWKFYGYNNKFIRSWHDKSG